MGEFTGERFTGLMRITQLTLVVDGIYDEVIPVRNSYWLGEKLPNAVLLVYPDTGHGSLFKFHNALAQQVSSFLASVSGSAVY